MEGFAPTIDDCSDFRDGLGHLTPADAEAVAHEIATYYKSELGVPESPASTSTEAADAIPDPK